jgi:glucosylceramidase
MANFSIDRDKTKLIPFIKAALQVKPDIHLWASPGWCPRG